MIRCSLNVQESISEPPCCEPPAIVLRGLIFLLTKGSVYRILPAMNVQSTSWLLHLKIGGLCLVTDRGGMTGPVHTPVIKGSQASAWGPFLFTVPRLLRRSDSPVQARHEHKQAKRWYALMCLGRALTNRQSLRYKNRSPKPISGKADLGYRGFPVQERKLCTKAHLIIVGRYQPDPL